MALGFAVVPTAANAVVAEPAGYAWVIFPGTKAVDVEVTAPSGATVLELNGGELRRRLALLRDPARHVHGQHGPGRCVGGHGPVISADIAVPAKSAMTVVAYGPSSDLEVKAVNDDLAAPTGGNARIRLFQASTITDSVDVETSTGMPIAKDAAGGTVTGYAEVPAGSWTLELTGGGKTATAEVDVAAGSVSTLFVLDTADGG